MIVKILLLFFIIEFVLYFLINKVRDRFASRENWPKHRLITNIITSKDRFPSIDKRGLYRFSIYFYDSEIGSMTKPNTSNIETHETAKGEVVTTSYKINSSGSRINPSHEHLTAKIACFGDSMTFCRHVNDNETYQYYLSELSKYNVTNYAVGNYGVDQAYMRFKREIENNNIKEPVILIGVSPETIRRSLSCWKHYFEFGNIYNFKPRFKIENGRLELIPNTINKLNRYYDLKKYLKDIKKNDYFYKKKFNKLIYEFPYTLSILKSPVRKTILLLFFGITYFSELLNRDWTKSKLFFNNSELMNGLKKIGGLYFDFKDKVKFYKNKEIIELTVSIINEFSDCVRKNNKIPYLIILPSKTDIEYIKKNKDIYYKPLMDKTSQFIKVLDLSNEFVRIRDLDSIYADKLGYGAHYNAEGNKIVAKSICDFLNIEKQ